MGEGEGDEGNSNSKSSVWQKLAGRAAVPAGQAVGAEDDVETTPVDEGEAARARRRGQGGEGWRIRAGTAMVGAG